MSPIASGEASAERRAALRWARDLVDELGPRFELSVVLHAAPARRGAEGWVDGPLLAAPEWTAGRPAAGLCATRALLAGLDDLAGEPAGEHLYWVR